MNRDLHAEVAAFLAEHGPSTSVQVAAGIRARRAPIDEVLLAGPFVEASTPEGANPRARHWVVVGIQSQSVLAPRGGKLTDNDFLIAVLSDGNWHSLNEILTRSFRERGCGLTVHSRASELRRLRGCVIEQRHTTTPNDRRGSEYRLIAQHASVEAKAA